MEQKWRCIKCGGPVIVEKENRTYYMICYRCKWRTGNFQSIQLAINAYKNMIGG